MDKIKHEDELVGIRFWAEFNMAKQPCYEVYVYFGRATRRTKAGSEEVFYFRHRKSQTTIVKTWTQIMKEYPLFRPFLLDMQKLRENWERQGELPDTETNTEKK